MREIDLTGKLVGERYTVIRSLGSGGMATIYLALDRRLQRRVVIKVPHAPLLAEPGFRERFLREVQSLTRLPHPSIVKVLDAGTVGETPFAVLEYLRGGSLGDRLRHRDEGVPPGEVAEWLPAVAQALDHIHRQGVVHRDVKPGNVLFDRAGHPFLTDFGISKSLRAAGPELTRTGMAPGSPGYLPPEVLANRVEPGYDQFSLAAVVVRALTGRPPDALDAAGDAGERLGSRLPAASAAAVVRALSPRPEGRFPDCESFALAFARGLAPKAAGRKAGSKAGATPWIAAGAGLVLAAAAAVVLFGGKGGSGEAVPAPRVTVESPEPGTLTNHASVRVRGRVEGPPGVRVLVNDESARVLPGGEFEATVPLRDGDNRLTVLADVEGGPASERVVRRVFRDGTPPRIRVDAPGETEEERVRLTGSVDEEGCEVSVGAAKAAVRGKEFEVEVALEPGENRIEIRVRDRAGNRSTKAVTVFRGRKQETPDARSPSPGDRRVRGIELTRLNSRVATPLPAPESMNVVVLVDSGGGLRSAGGALASAADLDSLLEGRARTSQLVVAPDRAAPWKRVLEVLEAGRAKGFLQVGLGAAPGSDDRGDLLHRFAFALPAGPAPTPGRFEIVIRIEPAGGKIRYVLDECAGRYRLARRTADTPLSLAGALDGLHERNRRRLGVAYATDPARTPWAVTAADGVPAGEVLRVLEALRLVGIDAMRLHAWPLPAGSRPPPVPLPPPPANAVAYAPETVRRFSTLFASHRFRPAVPTWSEQGLLQAVHVETELVFALIPGGKLRRPGNPGAPEGATREIAIAPFLLSRTECTVMARGGIRFAGAKAPERFRVPVSNESWTNLNAWCAAIGARFPSEAEWEYACRAGSETTYHFGDDPAGLPDHAWFFRNSGEDLLPEGTEWNREKVNGVWKCRAHPVAGKKPNAFGLYDMHGNVSELCADRWFETLAGAPADGSARTEGTEVKRVARGGSWWNSAKLCTSEFRFSVEPGAGYTSVGFRPAASLPVER